jgi:HEAT repeat protein
MPSREDVRRELDKDELNYPRLATELGPEALPQLQELVAEDEPRIAPKAAYLAGLIAGPTSHEVVSLAAGSKHEVVRVAAAAALPALSAEHAGSIGEQLLADPDVGVRARAVTAVGSFDEALLTDQLRAIAEQDPEPAVRDLAAEIAQEPPG